MIRFEKVSYKQFEKDSIALGFTPTKEIYDAIKLPERGSKGSAGYDFVTPYDVILSEKNNANTAVIPTGIRCCMDDDKVLLIAPRSGLGFKTGMKLANTVGVIDSDYYHSDNEGHIMAKFVRGFKDLTVHSGERIMQGIITIYFTIGDDKTSCNRNGGFGSTGK